MKKYKTYPVQYKLIGKDIVNVVDKYGMKQGPWTFDSVQMTKYYLFENSVATKAVRKKWSAIMIDLENRIRTKMESAKNGDINGQLVYEGSFKRQKNP